MQRKMKTYREKRNNKNNGANPMLNKEGYPNAPITLTDFNFNESVHKFPVLIVDFWAAWCGPCRMVSPVIDQLSSELAGKAVFGKLNVDDNTNTSNVLGIQSIPTIVVFKNGQAVDRIIGAMTKSHMISKISPYI